MSWYLWYLVKKLIKKHHKSILECHVQEIHFFVGKSIFIEPGDANEILENESCLTVAYFFSWFVHA